MDRNLWRNSKIDVFPFNVPLPIVFLSSITLVVLAGVLPYGNHLLLRKDFCLSLVTSLSVSVAAYLVTDRLIISSMKPLADKDIFGKDLNKAGDMESKPKV